MKERKKKSKLAKENAVLRELLSDLVMAAERVDFKYGSDEDGNPLDWNAWVALRRYIQNARTKGKIS